MDSTAPDRIRALGSSPRIGLLKQRMLAEPRYLSLEQAAIVTQYYRAHPDVPRNLQRAESLAETLRKIEIRIDPLELIVGNRTAGVRAGVVSPEAGISWLDGEIEHLPVRAQDRFQVRPQYILTFRRDILPFWKGKSLEDRVKEVLGEEIAAIGKVAKINQTDHAQGHICPDTSGWLEKGPRALRDDARARADRAAPEKRDFYLGMVIALDGAIHFMGRYAALARGMAAGTGWTGQAGAAGAGAQAGQAGAAQAANQAEQAGAAQVAAQAERRANLEEIARICDKLSREPPSSFREAVQSLWFLFVLLQAESNASSFSPGRADQYLYPFYRREIDAGTLDEAGALEIIEALWLKFNQVVYLRNSNSARYFAGFPIGFNVALGGLDERGGDASNELSFLFLRAQAHIGLPQPNLSARLSEKSPEELVRECARVIGLGSGMPQVFNDESIVPALMARGISREDATNYAIVGCVELTTHGNALGWSDAAMFNMVKVLELTLNHGVCLLSGKKMGLDLGSLPDYASYEALENAFRAQADHFIGRMIRACDAVDRLHAEVLPSPLLSSVIRGCAEKGLDVTAGGACYNLSGIQAIQPANLADCLAAIKQCVFDRRTVTAADALAAIRGNWAGQEAMRQYLVNKVPKYGNDVEWVDEIAAKWIGFFAARMGEYTNARGGPYHAGLYTVSAHVPMGQNVGASLDGRRARDPLADGGMSAMYGRDRHGPTALLRSVSRVSSRDGSNGTLLNMKFLPDFFRTEEGIAKFAAFLRSFVRLRINHVQFNVVRREDLLAAKADPEAWRGLTVRVAGYTAYFTELAGDLQDEIISRTSYGDL
ncbi:MAG TPA: pyruvate formate lyase family protein [Spirochaetia bacterium]|nr:pyruvate formate lyase family protein [Spirochaetia bacterium]